MSFATKVAVVFVCLAICATGMFIIPRESKTSERPPDRGTPVLLHESRPIRGLRV
jgi:hypothetical protein